MKTIILTAFIFGMISCNSSKDANNSKAGKELSDSYKIVSIEGVKSLATIPTMKFDFALNKVSGNAGCNNYEGSMSMDGNKIKFSEFMSTKMYCDNMNIEREFLSKLNIVAYFRTDEHLLKMYNSQDELLLVFEEDN